MTKHERMLLRYKIVCKCNHISRLTIMETIEAGACNMSQIERACAAHTGSCGGVRCGPLIEEMLEQFAEPPAKDIETEVKLQAPAQPQPAKHGRSRLGRRQGHAKQRGGGRS